MPGSTLNLPVINLDLYVADPTSGAAFTECKRAADALLKYSALAVRTSNATEQQNNQFLDMMEDYFDQQLHLKMEDTRPQFGYQVGATPELTEVPKCGKDEACLELVSKMGDQDKPAEFSGADPKWRFFHRYGATPVETQFKALNIEPVQPKAFPQWLNVMDTWGETLFGTVDTLAEMIAIGLGLPKDTFTNLTDHGPHLVAPTGSDLEKYNQVGTVLAGFHYDLNFLTIHGKSRFPGLNIWARSGQKLKAKIPDGCLLVQTGKQMEWLTGGYLQAGYHEVAVTDETIAAIDKQEQKQRPLWRISSTMFYHVQSDKTLKPLAHFASIPGATEKYPAMLTGHQVEMELGILELKKDN